MKKTGTEDENEMFPHKKKQLENNVIFFPAAVKLDKSILTTATTVPPNVCTETIFFLKESKFC